MARQVHLFARRPLAAALRAAAPRRLPVAQAGLPGRRALRRNLQAEYEEWRAGLPESLADSRTAQLLENVCDVDLEELDIELPRGFARD